MKLQLSEPLYLELELPASYDNQQTVKVDAFEARRMLIDASKQPNEDSRWKMVKKWLGDKLGVDPASIAESTTLEFHNIIIRLTDDFVEKTSKNIKGMLCSPQPTQASPETT